MIQAIKLLLLINKDNLKKLIDKEKNEKYFQLTYQLKKNDFFFLD